MDQGRLAFTAVYLKSNHGYIGFIEELPGVNSHGRTLEEARETLQKLATVVFDAGPAWNPEEADELAEETHTLAVRDPLQHGLSKRLQAYYRLPGPAGHKSRYEDPAIERLAEIAKDATHEHAHYVFTNVDMFADGRRFKRAIGL